MDLCDGEQLDSFFPHTQNNLARVGCSLGPGARNQLLLEVVDQLVGVHCSNRVPVLCVSGHRRAPCIGYLQNWTANSSVVRSLGYCCLGPAKVDHFFDLINLGIPFSSFGCRSDPWVEFEHSLATELGGLDPFFFEFPLSGAAFPIFISAFTFWL